MVTAEEIKAKIEESIECVHVEIEAYKGEDHFRALVVSAEFAGISRLQQHKKVYASLQDDMRQAVHALQLTTWAPKEWEDKKNQPEREPGTRVGSRI